MPIRRHGRAAPLRGAVGLIVCVACAVSAAGPTFVRPDEAAGLSAVVPSGEAIGDSGGPVDARVAEPQREGHGLEEHVWHEGEGGRAPSVRGHAFGLGPATHVENTSATPLQGVPPLCGFSTDTFDIGGQAASATLPLFFEDDLPPVVRGQSADIDLLPLSTGDASIENTSLMSWATGTQGRIRGDYLTDFDETDRIGVQALTQGWLGIGLDAEANYWQRPVDDRGREPIWTGDLNVIYNLVPHPRFKFRSGAGAAWTLEDGKPHAGYNVTHGLDVYLLWRAMATGEIDWGKLDDDDLFRYRLALGITVKSFEIYSGYESYKLGGEKMDGWVNGVAWWY